jgi:hypothetical protein
MTGLMVSGAVVLVSFVLIGMAGTNSHSAPATTGGALIVLAILGAVVCTIAAISRRVRRGKHGVLGQVAPAGPNSSADPYPLSDFTNTADSLSYPGHQIAGNQRPADNQWSQQWR